jgi:invasion protein IalB
MMMTKRVLIGSLVMVLLLAACIIAPAPDPCASQPDSDQCNLVQAQVRVTLNALHRTQTAEANAANAQATVTAYAPTATALAQQTATAVATAATATVAARQTATATAAIPTATEAARLSAVATETTYRVTATAEALYALDVQSQTNQKNIELAFSGLLAVLIELLKLLLIIVVPIAVACVLYHLSKIIQHWLQVKAATVRSTPKYRSGADGALMAIDSPYLVFPNPDGSFDIVDPDRMIGAHIDSRGRGQPLDDPEFNAHAAQWKIMRQASARDQLVELYRRSMSGPDSAPLQIEAPVADEREIIPGEYTIVNPNSEINGWLDEVEQRLLKAGAA